MNVQTPVILRVDRPTLLLDTRRARRNIERMAARARRAGVSFRPHFKTHQSREIGHWFRDHGVDRITVASLDMARYFARDGWQDITIAFPLNPRELPGLEQLASQVTLGVLVDTREAVETLCRSRARFLVWIKIDVGTRRAGVPWDDPEAVLTLASAIRNAPRLVFAGILAHAGHSYLARGAAAVSTVHMESSRRLRNASQALRDAGFTDFAVSSGDTPCCSVADSFDGIDEIRPGNFVFYDLTQWQIGACTAHDIALAVACPVVSVYRERGDVLVRGGAVHFSKEALHEGEPPVAHYGLLAKWEGDTWGDLDGNGRLISLSQEHGMVRFDPTFLQHVHVGDVLVFFPVHSCLTADLYDAYRTLEGGTIRRRRSNDTQT